MCVSKPLSTARLEHLVDHAADRGWYPFWRVAEPELRSALDRARTDARTFERSARQRRKAVRLLSILVKRRAEFAAIRAARDAEMAARRQRLAAVVDAPLEAAE